MDPEDIKDQEQEHNILIRLKGLRDDWSDEIPNKILHGDSEVDAPKFKVRKNWWESLVGNLDLLIDLHQLPLELEQEIELFDEKYAKEIKERLATAEDIAEANALITKILESQKEN
jgi:hypothetical protein